MKKMEYNIKVLEKGLVKFYVPFPAGSHIRLFIIGEPTDDRFDDLLKAADSSTDFWNNPFDDEDSLLRFKEEIKLKSFEQSADLYAEIYDEDIELQELTETAIQGWPE